MTRKHNMSKGERFESMERRVQNLEMSTRVLQMVMQQVGSSISPMSKDMGELSNLQRDLQYRVLAVQKMLTLDVDTITRVAEELQVKDFEEASDKEDAANGYTVADVVAEDSAVILTSTTPDQPENAGFLRSKLKMSDIAFPDLREQLLGKTVGANITVDINNVKHNITLLGIRTIPAPATTPAEKPELNG